MPYSPQEIKNLKEEKKPAFGWIKVGYGHFVAEDDFLHNKTFMTENFQKFSERMQARWNFLEYFRVWWNQRKK